MRMSMFYYVKRRGKWFHVMCKIGLIRYYTMHKFLVGSEAALKAGDLNKHGRWNMAKYRSN